jgi:hypothetical protein
MASKRVASTESGFPALRGTGYVDAPFGPSSPWSDRLEQWLESYENEIHVADDPAAKSAAQALEAFICFTFEQFEWAWFHSLVCQELEWWLSTPNARLMVSLPPRHGKSEIVSRRLPSYILGRDPDAQVIAATYAMSLAKRMNRDVQRIMETPEYAAVFPGVELYSKASRRRAKGTFVRTSDLFEIVNRKGSYRSAGIGTGITGMGFTHGIIDDPVKDRAAVESGRIRQATMDWYTSTFLTRQAPGARILITQTRWHHLDLTGSLQELADADPKADQWRVVNLPAICDRPSPGDTRAMGEALWASRFPVEKLESIKASSSSRDWQALYQGRPSATAGLGICYESFANENVARLPIQPGDRLWIACDFNIDPMSWLIGFRRNDHIHVLEELVIPNCNVQQMCEAVRTRIRPYRAALNYGEYSPLPVSVYGDASGKNRDMGGESAWARVNEWFVKNKSSFSMTLRSHKGNPFHVDRVAAVNAMLCSASGYRRLTADPSCKQLKLDFERVSWAKDSAGRSIGQIDKSDPNRTHTSDALGYLIEYEFPQTHRGGFGSKVIA